MTIDNPPSDQEILAVIERHQDGIAPEDLIREMLTTYEERAIIEALQRVFERGKVDFSADALLIPAREVAQAA